MRSSDPSDPWEDWPRRRLARLSEQAAQYLETQGGASLGEINEIIQAIESGVRDEEISFWVHDSKAQFGRRVTLLNNGDILIWREYADQAPFFSIFYIGPPSGYGEDFNVKESQD